MNSNLFKVGIINSGYGNILSIRNMLKRIEVEPLLVESPEQFKECDKLILPGVGSFDKCVLSLRERGLDTAIKNWVKSQKPFMGICVGAQVLGSSSEEGLEQGLDLLAMKVIKLKGSEYNLPIPHMSWNTLNLRKEHAIVHNLETEHRFYFVHSYHFHTEDDSLIVADTQYGQTFPSIVAHQNLVAVQFHPEKSQRHGMQILNNFVSYVN